MEAAGALIAERPDLHVQTHLSENRAECEFAVSLFPFAADYTAIYERYGFLGPRTLFGHCVHLSDREIGALAESGSVAVFNPTSNLFLGSGLFDLARLRRGSAPGPPSRPTSAPAPAIRCCARWTRPTRSCSCRARSSAR